MRRDTPAHPPRIGIAAAVRDLPMPPGPLAAHTVLDLYVDAVVAAGGLPLVLPVLDAGAAPALVGAIDGLILAGGPDLDPARSGADGVRRPIPGLGTARPAADLRRDAAEVALVDAASAAHLPTLAICRGLQVVAVARGGSLHGHVDGHEGPWVEHLVAVTPGSRLHAVAGADHVGTGSFHHQAVDRLGDGLVVTGTAEDGTVEALEDTGAWPLVAVQWHPEIERTPLADALFGWLVTEAAR